MRILVDQSGYDLMNIGDIAMLQGCVARLRSQWPDAEIMVIARDPQRLQSFCPGTVAIRPGFPAASAARGLGYRGRLACGQAWKVATPYFCGRRRPGHGLAAHPRTAIQAVRAADVVVASGGGYVTDVWWWHAAGVLSLLAMAQRLGKPTAMFGQGLGPVGNRALRAQAAAVLPGLTRLGLRERQTGPDLARSLGVRAEIVTVTGDDALEIAGGSSPRANTAGGPGGSSPQANTAGGPGGSSPRANTAIGVNMRVAGYSGVGPEAATVVGGLVADLAEWFGAPVVSLPVSLYPADSDARTYEALLRGGSGPARGPAVRVDSPAALISATAACRAIVTGSYHVAVFGLALGVPCVCVTRSPYYDAKFSGLQELFPAATSVVSLAAPDFADRLRAAIGVAWNLPAAERAVAGAISAQLRQAGTDAYAGFRAAVDNSARVAQSCGSSQ
jgi:polysaccharide pyruvyl transferase WcaK-like protein